MTELPWYKNRKWMVPLFTAIVEVVLIVAAAAIGYENLPFTARDFGELLATAWLVVTGVVSGGDVLFDLLGQIVLIMNKVIEARNQPPAVG